MKYYLSFPIIALLSVIMLAATSCKHGHYLDNEGLKVGDTLPEFVVTSLDGKATTSASIAAYHSGEPYGLLTFRGDCTSCETLLRLMARVMIKNERTIPIVAVSLCSKEETIAYLSELGILDMIEVYLAGAKTVYDISGDTLPMLAVFNDEGVVSVCIHREQYTEKKLAEILAIPANGEEE